MSEMQAPGSAQQMMAAAVALEAQGRTTEAMSAYEQLLVIWPGLPNAWYNIGRLQRHAGLYARALASYQEALERSVARPEEVHLNRGVIFSDCLNQYEAAERELKRALEINPRYVPALINYANLHEDLGRRELAAEMYERLLALDPDSPTALARYAGLKSFSDPADPLIERMRKATIAPGINLRGLANLEFSLGRALDAAGSYEAAFQMYRQANRHSREDAPPGSANYNLALQERFTDQLIDTFRRPFRAVAEGEDEQGTPQPIFICGMFRSGSTLLEQLLAAHPQITAGGELEYISRAVNTDLAPFPQSMKGVDTERLRRLATQYRSAMSERFPSAAIVTDKRPDNFLYIGLIKALFPRAKIIHPVRSALDNCLSIYFLNLDASMSYALDLMDIGHYYREYQRLMAHWKGLFNSDIIDVHYEALVKDPKRQLEQVLGQLGLVWDDAYRTRIAKDGAVKTASVWQVREPIHERSIGRSANYLQMLQELHKYLEHRM